MLQRGRSTSRRWATSHSRNIHLPTGCVPALREDPFCGRYDAARSPAPRRSDHGGIFRSLRNRADNDQQFQACLYDRSRSDRVTLMHPSDASPGCEMESPCIRNLPRPHMSFAGSDVRRARSSGALKSDGGESGTLTRPNETVEKASKTYAFCNARPLPCTTHVYHICARMRRLLRGERVLKAPTRGGRPVCQHVPILGPEDSASQRAHDPFDQSKFNFRRPIPVATYPKNSNVRPSDS